MNNKILKANCILISSLLLICGCSNNSDNMQANKNIVAFDKDSNTVHYAAINNDIMRENTMMEQNVEREIIPIHEEELNLGELIITGDDLEIQFSEDGGNIMYNGKTFHNLANIINNLDINYNKDNLITFIVKYTDFDTNLVYTDFEEDHPDDFGFGVDDQLCDNETYLSLKDKYGESVTWNISLLDSTDVHKHYELYGAKSYILLVGATGDVELTTSQLNAMDNATNHNTVTVSENTGGYNEEESNNQ